VYERRQQWQAAKDLLAKWIALDPDSAAAHQRLGVTLFRLKDAAGALAEFKKARDLRPDSQHPDVLLGQLYTQDGETEKARASFERAYQQEQKNEATAQAYAEWLIQQNNLDKAQEVAAAMRKQAPDSLRALLLDGVVAKMRGQPKAAEEALLKVLQVDPGNASATNLLALVLAESASAADQEKALNYARMNAERFSTNPQANVTFAWVLYKLGRTNEAQQVLNRSGQSNLNADSAFLVAQIMVDANQKENARRVLDQVLKQAGAGMFLYRKDAEALLKQLGGPMDSEPAPPSSGVTDPGAPAPGASGPAPGAGTSQP
jgi:tetratricopeptide (TPR) repeat protein